MATRPGKNIRDFEALGFRVLGTDGSGHLILEHEQAGRISISKTPSDWRTRSNELASAKRQLLRGKAAGQLFLEWLWEHYDVPADGSRRITGTLVDMIDRWAKAGGCLATGGRPVQAVAIGRWVVESPYVDTIKRAHGTGGTKGNKAGASGQGIYLVRGKNAIIVEPAKPAKPRANGTGIPVPERVRELQEEHAEVFGAEAQPGIEIAPGVTFDPTTVPAPAPVAPEPAKNGHANGHAESVEHHELDDIKALLNQVAKAVGLPAQQQAEAQRRDLALEALASAERVLNASQQAIGDALEEVRAAMALLDAEAVPAVA